MSIFSSLQVCFYSENGAVHVIKPRTEKRFKKTTSFYITPLSLQYRMDGYSVINMYSMLTLGNKWLVLEFDKTLEAQYH